MTPVGGTLARRESFGQRGLSPIDRLGVWLSRRAIVKHVDRERELRILDLGCGYHATLLTSLGDWLAEGVGVDVAVSAQARAVPKLRFVEGRIEEVLPTLEAGRFDVVMLISVLEHLVDPEAALVRCRELLRSGGRLIVNVPTWRGKIFLELSAFRLGFSPRDEMDDHKMYYDRRDLWPLLVRAGFKPSGLSLRYHKFGLNLFAVGKR